MALGEHEHGILLDRRMRSALDSLFKLLGRSGIVLGDKQPLTFGIGSAGELFIWPQSDGRLHFVVLHARVEAGYESHLRVVFACFDNSLDCHWALNRPSVAIEVTVDALDLVALLRVKHGVLFVFLPPFARTGRLLITDPATPRPLSVSRL